METADSIAERYRENTAGDDPDPAYVEQLLAALEPGERALVVDVCDGRSLEWEWLTNHQPGPAAEAIRAARDALGGS